ncbi:MAG: hypothetical protein IJ563_11020 [Selenomonadaceae bacterium]|nr:hypothetical protein [Selenomonadaceae bacterium]
MGPNEKGHLQLTINIADGTAGCINTINSRDENGSVNDTTTTDENGNTVNVSGGYLDRVISHEFTHGIMQSMLKEGVMANLPSWVKEGGTAEMTHGADERDLVSAASNPFDGDAYAGGFVAMRFLAKSIGNSPQDTMKKMMRGLIASDNLDGALQYVSGGAFNEQGFKDMYNAALAKYNGDTTAFLKEACGINQNNNDTGSATGWDAGNRVVKTNYNVLPQASRPVNWSLPGSTTTAIKGLVINWPKGYAAGTTGGSLNFHTGAGANQSIHVGLFDMRARSIGLIDQEGNKLNVSTIGNANQSIGLLDKIANVVLDEATNIGSIEARLEYTSSNLTTASENVQSAESTIRDADMAKEMTEYTKNNVLLQASQSMLAQANQSASNVLSLLQ